MVRKKIKRIQVQLKPEILKKVENTANSEPVTSLSKTCELLIEKGLEAVTPLITDK